MTAGRKPIPTVLKMIRGNPGKRRLNVDEPQPDGLSTAVPQELTEITDETVRKTATAEWTRTIVPAINRGQVTSGDRAFAIAHCELWATWRSQLALAARSAHVVAVGANNHPIPNPARVMANKTFLLLAKCDAELGLTPSSRSRVSINKAGRPMSAVEKFKAEKKSRRA